MASTLPVALVLVGVFAGAAGASERVQAMASGGVGPGATVGVRFKAETDANANANANANASVLGQALAYAQANSDISATAKAGDAHDGVGDDDTHAGTGDESSGSGQWSVGFALYSGPRYAGSDERQFTGGPFVSYNDGMFYLNPLGGLGVQYATDYGTSFQAGIAYDGGRDDRRRNGFFGGGSDKLAGMGKVKGSGILALDVSQSLASWLTLDAGAELRLFGNQERGNTFELGVTLTPYESDVDTVSVGLHVHRADRKYSQTYFGVTEAQSLRTPYGVYRPGAGGIGSSVSVDWGHVLDRHWSILGNATLFRLSNRLRESPIVFRRSNTEFVLGLTYTF